MTAVAGACGMQVLRFAMAVAGAILLVTSPVDVGAQQAVAEKTKAAARVTPAGKSCPKGIAYVSGRGEGMYAYDGKTLTLRSLVSVLRRASAAGALECVVIGGVKPASDGEAAHVIAEIRSRDITHIEWGDVALDEPILQTK